jgi:hypothetical protein
MSLAALGATQVRRPLSERLQSEGGWWTRCAYWSTRLVLGAAGRLFGKVQDKILLRLVESRPLGAGVVSMIYAPAMADR